MPADNHYVEGTTPESHHEGDERLYVVRMIAATRSTPRRSTIDNVIAVTAPGAVSGFSLLQNHTGTLA